MVSTPALDTHPIKPEGTIAKPGEYIRIIANCNEHHFQLGEIVRVTDFESGYFGGGDEEAGVEAKGLNKSDEYWFVRHTDYVVLTL